MWAKVAKLASPAPRKPSSSTSKPTADEPTFLRLVEQLSGLLDSPSGDGRSPVQTRENVARLLGELLRVLKAEQASAAASSPLPPCLERLLLDNVLATLVGLVEKDEPQGVREELVRWYGRAIVELDEGWLSHSAVNKPLVKLLRTCVDEEGGLMRQEELAVVEVMCIVAERIKTRPELLAIFFREKSGSRRQKDLSSSIAAAINRPVPLTTISRADDDGRPSSPTLSQASTSEASVSFAASQTSSAASPRRRADHDFLLFSYLLRFIHREGDVGDYAREGILSLVDVAFGYPNLYNPSFALQRSSPSSTISPSSILLTPPNSTAAAREAVLAFAEYLLDSDFAEVLGAGLGALYGLLPGKLVVRTSSASGDATPRDGEAAMAGGMVLGGMGALHSEEDAEALERKKEEEEDRLRAEGYGLTGTGEFREGLDGFLKLVEFTQDILRRSTDGILLEESGDDDSDDARQQKLVMNALTAAVLSAVRNLFLQSVLYPSILECSEADGSAVAVMSYLDAMLEVVQEGTKLEAAVLGYLLAEDDSLEPQQRPPPRRSDASSASASASPRVNLLSPPASKVKRRKSSALLLIEQAAGPHDPSSDNYFTSLGRFSLRDLLLSHVQSSSQPTAAAALKLLQTLLTRHDRWSLALLDVTLDDGATAFPVALREPPSVNLDDDDDSDEEFVYRPSSTPKHDDSSDDEFTYRSPSSPTTPRTAPTSLAPSAFTKTPARAHDRLLGTPLPSTPSITLHLDSLDTLFSLVSTIDPSYRRLRSANAAAGGTSEMLTTGFANYLRDAEATLANEAGFRRGLAAPPVLAAGAHEGEDDSRESQPRRRRSTLFGSAPTLSGRDFAAAPTGHRHKLRPTVKLVALLLESLAAFFSHSPNVNLSLTAVLAAMAAYPYRSLEGWLLPVVRAPRADVADTRKGPQGRKREEGESPRSDDGDDRSVDFEVDERGRHDALLSPLPSRQNSSSLFGPGLGGAAGDDAPPSATRAALSTSDSLLSVLDALAKSVEHYRRTIPGFDTFLSERRQGLFFAENLADALEADELGGAMDDNAFGPPAPPEPLAAPPPAAKKSASPSLGLGGFFSPRRPSSSHKRSPSSPANAYSTPTKPSSHAPSRPSQLRRSASEESLALPASPLPANGANASLAPPPAAAATKAGPASPFAAHYRETGAITVKPVVVSTPGLARRTRALEDNDDEDEDEDEDEEREEGPSDSPTKRLSTAPSPSASAARSPRSSSPSGRSTASSALPSEAKKRPASPAAVSLSTVLDNVIVLEEFVKELAAIVYVRRAVGIDAVSFV
ncbi:hypothetical protein JCM6882_005711 [Rhodosporidiobolus microsporus]